VRVLMNVLKVLLVDVRVRVRLSGVAVFMLVLNVLVIVQDVRVGVRHFPMRVLMRVLLHRFPVLRSIRSECRVPRRHMRIDGGLHQPMLHDTRWLPASFSVAQINAPILQLTPWCRCIFLLPSNGQPHSCGLRNPQKHLGEAGLP
jgi:hypothetical protein